MLQCQQAKESTSVGNYAYENPGDAPPGFSIPILSTAGLNAAGWLPIILAVQPFDDVMASYASRNSD